MNMKDLYNGLDPQWRQMVAGSDQEAAQYDQVINAGRPAQPQPSAPSLSRAEQERMDAAIQHNIWCRRLGSEPDPEMLLPTTETDPGARGPWGAAKFGKARSNEELTAQIRRTAETIVERALKGDPEAQAFVAKSQSSHGTGAHETGTRHSSTAQDFIRRMAERADEFCENSIVRDFVKALAAGDRPGMRAAVRPMVLELVAG